MIITEQWLNEKNACPDGRAWFVAQQETEAIKVAKALVKDQKLDYANWLVTRLMTHKQCIQYAVFAAKQVLNLFERRYPKDKRSREAIKAALAYLKNPSDRNRQAADAAYAAADAAYDASDAAYDAAYDAVYAAYAAVYAAADTAYAAVYAAYAAVYAAYAAADAAMKTKIVRYGIKLLKNQ